MLVRGLCGGFDLDRSAKALIRGFVVARVNGFGLMAPHAGFRVFVLGFAVYSRGIEI